MRTQLISALLALASIGHSAGLNIGGACTNSVESGCRAEIRTGAMGDGSVAVRFWR